MLYLGQFKRGDTFNFNAAIAGVDELPLEGVAANLKCQVRKLSDEFVDDCVITEVTPAGTYNFLVADTTGWIIGDLLMDIQITEGGVITSSETFKIKIVKDVTHDE